MTYAASIRCGPATTTSTRSCSPRTRRRWPRRSTATAKGSTPTPAGYLREHEAALDDAVLQAAARHLGVQPEEVALTDSTTMGLGLLYGGLRLRDGEEVVTTTHDFYSTYAALRLSGARVRRIRLYRDPAAASVDEILAAVRQGIGPRTRVLALTWVHSSTGVKLPLAEIAKVLPERVMLCVDAVHALGVEPPVVGPAFLSAGTHKWLAGPRGTGILYGRRGAWAEVGAIIPPFGGGAPGASHTPGGYHSFEHRWALADAFKLHAKIGPERIQARIHSLASRLKDGLAEIPRVTLKTPRDPGVSAGLTCCLVDGEDPPATVSRLRAQKVLASVTPYATPYVRFGTGLFSGESDVDAAVGALRG